LAPWVRAFPATVAAWKLPNLALITLLPLATFLLARDRLGPGWAASAALLVAASPHVLAAGQEILSESGFALSALFGLVLLGRDLWVAREGAFGAYALTMANENPYDPEAPGKALAQRIGEAGERAAAYALREVPDLVLPWHTPHFERLGIDRVRRAVDLLLFL